MFLFNKLFFEKNYNVVNSIERRLSGESHVTFIFFHLEMKGLNNSEHGENHSNWPLCVGKIEVGRHTF